MNENGINSANSKRQVDLISYLPPFMAEYEEINNAFSAENPELQILWDGKERVLKNVFILTADSEGLSRFEGLLGILPSKNDTLKSRRQRVLSRWFKRLPYTERMLLEKLVTLLGEKSFVFQKDYDHYKITLTTGIELYGQIEEVERLLEEMLPANLAAAIQNRIKCGIKGDAKIYSGIRAYESFLITNDFKESHSIKGIAGAAGTVSEITHISITQ